MRKQKSLLKRLEDTAYCDPSCEGRCIDCPHEVNREAAEEITKLLDILSGLLEENELTEYAPTKTEKEARQLLAKYNRKIPGF